MLAHAIPFVAIFMCGVVYVALAYAGGAWLARRHSLRVDRRFLLARLRWLALAVVVPGLLVACTEVAPSAAGPITSLVAALVLLCMSLLALLDGTITLQDHRRALVGRDLDGVTRRMRERAAKTRGGTTRLGVDAHVRQVLEDAGVLLLAGLGEEALRFTAEELVTPIRMTEKGPPPLAPPDWAHAWAAALRALYALSDGRDPGAVAEALPSSPRAEDSARPGRAPPEAATPFRRKVRRKHRRPRSCRRRGRSHAAWPASGARQPPRCRAPARRNVSRPSFTTSFARTATRSTPPSVSAPTSRACCPRRCASVPRASTRAPSEVDWPSLRRR